MLILLVYTRLTMKLTIITLLVCFLIGNQVSIASDQLISTSDSVKIEKFELPEKTTQLEKSPFFNINLATGGLFINKTFGIHPLLSFSFDILKHKNIYKFVYEARYGHSKNHYQILDNDTLKSTNVFNGQYVGFEYERMLYWHPYSELYGNIGIGYDWIKIQKGNAIQNKHTIGGIGLNLGIRYCFYIHKKHGPDFGIFYHFADFNNKSGTKLNNNSVGIRISYDLGRLSSKS